MYRLDLKCSRKNATHDERSMFSGRKIVYWWTEKVQNIEKPTHFSFR